MDMESRKLGKRADELTDEKEKRKKQIETKCEPFYMD